MTLNAFIKQLQTLQAAGHGRDRVTVDKYSLWDGNGTLSICDINSMESRWIRQVDGDGFQIYLKDRTEKQSRCIVLNGEKAIQ